MSLVAFDRSEIERLLLLLDARLQQRGTAGSVYVVGGAAIAMTVYDGRRTADIDALVSDEVVLEEARRLAELEGIPPTWLNESAMPWIPPRPPAAAVAPTRSAATRDPFLPQVQPQPTSASSPWT